MPGTLEWYNLTSEIAYPFVEDSNFTMGAEILPNGAFLDLELLTLVEGPAPFTLVEVDITAPNYVFTFDYLGTPVIVMAAATGTWPLQVSQQFIPVLSTTFIIHMTLGEALTDIPDGTYTLDTPLPVEPARIRANPRSQLNTLTVGVETFNGDVCLEQGYNMQILFSPGSNVIRFSPVLGAGKGESCEELSGDNDCNELLYDINSQAPDSLGIFQLLGNGLTIINDPANNKIIISSPVDPSRPKCKDEA
jgi:hypothetical protein